MKKKKPKIVLWDLETLMNMDEIAKIFPSIGAYPGRTMKASITTIICFGYKELGDKKSKCVSAWDFPELWAKDMNNDKEVVKAAYEVLKDADGIVTHNGARFDLKFLNTRLMYHGLPPLAKIPHIDTVLAARSNLLLYSNRLNDVSKFFKCESKMENGGWQLWVDVLAGKKKAMKTMSQYCKQDVEVLEQVFLKLRPVIKNIPNYNLFRDSDDTMHCPSCGSSRMQKHGFRNSKTAKLQRYRCLDCGSTSTAQKGLMRSV